MNTYYKHIFSVLLITLLIACSGNKNTDSFSKSSFQHPSQNYKVHTWWHWMDGAITKEGITKDLEAMQKQGISQATIFNVSLFGGKDFGVPRVKFAGNEWFEMFRWALEEANRLGIKIGVHNCDGWSTSGGPWITPEKSMKQFVWSKTHIIGGQHVEINLPQPGAEQNFYKDVTVLAYKSENLTNSFQVAKPQAFLNDSTNATSVTDGSPITNIELHQADKIRFVFEKPFSTSKIAIHPHHTFLWEDMAKVVSKYTLYSSGNDKDFIKVKDFEAKGLNKTFIFNFSPVEAKYFKVELTGIENLGSWNSFYVAEIELLNEDEKPTYNPDIPNHLEKIVSVKAISLAQFDTINANLTNPDFIDENSIINLTGKMTSDGLLQWDAPDGKWTIIRFGFTTTGATNGPATAEGLGLECDKMDTSALNIHFRNFPQKLVDNAGKFTGNTFKFLLIDSWECKFQNWTDNFAIEFEKRRGYSIYNFIPVLCGETVGNPEISEAFLYDFRKTIADLIEENYYRYFGELCKKSNIEYHAEAIYGNTNYPPLDILKSNSYIDLPMYEFWAGTNSQSIIEYGPSARPEACFPYAASFIYNKPVMGSEAYTGFAHYSETPAALKPFGDRAYCMGINQIILHSNVHQPFEKTPGMTLGIFAAHFNRHNPWYKNASAWIDYQSRIQYILQNSQTVCDILYYVGDQLPQGINNPTAEKLPFGFNAVACNMDVLTNKISVQNNQLVLSENQRFFMLILPNNLTMELSTLQRIEELVKEGAVVYGAKPEKMLSLKGVMENKPAFDEITNKLWGTDNTQSENTYNKGKVIWGKSIAEALNDINAMPDFKTNVSDSLNLMYIHKKAENSDVYFVFNQQNTEINRECRFRVSDKAPEIWDPETGNVSNPAIFAIEGNHIRIPVTFAPYGSKIFVFNQNIPDNFIVKVNLDGKRIFPILSKETNIAVPYATYSDKNFEFFSKIDGDYTFIDVNKREIEIKLNKPEEFKIKDFKGLIEFQPSYQAEIKPVEIENLKPLTDFEQTDIKYFSGTAKYTINFDLPDGYVKPSEKLLLDIGVLESTAEISLNGAILGIAWKSGTTFEPVGLKQTGNILEISVSIVYRNRIIGDYQEYDTLNNIWTSAPVNYYLKKDYQLVPSGLIGPITLSKNKKS